ncbi:MAG: hypothetical protein HOE80_00515 [Candidatus Magasanikbacteria bacterium]|jgi:hypothetical protein|nr:hypothetical protein [Candidatus Magasanikbacteria bacterium]MBT4071194.1 hypothetical protein [Candidatus Magasanikbacteria bacterium]
MKKILFVIFSLSAIIFIFFNLYMKISIENEKGTFVYNYNRTEIKEKKTIDILNLPSLPEDISETCALKKEKGVKDRPERIILHVKRGVDGTKAIKLLRLLGFTQELDIPIEHKYLAVYGFPEGYKTEYDYKALDELYSSEDENSDYIYNKKLLENVMIKNNKLGFHIYIEMVDLSFPDVELYEGVLPGEKHELLKIITGSKTKSEVLSYIEPLNITPVTFIENTMEKYQGLTVKPGDGAAWVCYFNEEHLDILTGAMSSFNLNVMSNTF